MRGATAIISWLLLLCLGSASLFATLLAVSGAYPGMQQYPAGFLLGSATACGAQCLLATKRLLNITDEWLSFNLCMLFILMALLMGVCVRLSNISPEFAIEAASGMLVGVLMGAAVCCLSMRLIRTRKQGG